MLKKVVTALVIFMSIFVSAWFITVKDQANLYRPNPSLTIQNVNVHQLHFDPSDTNSGYEQMGTRPTHRPFGSREYIRIIQPVSD